MAERPPLPHVLTLMDQVEARHAPTQEREAADLRAQLAAAYAAQGLDRPAALIEAVVADHLSQGMPAVMASPVAPAEPVAFGWDRPADEASWHAALDRLMGRERAVHRLRDWAGSVGFFGWVAGVFFNWPTLIALHPWWWVIGMCVLCAGLEKVEQGMAQRRQPLDALLKLGAKRKSRWQRSPRAQAYLDACAAQPLVPLLRGDADRLDALADADQALQRSRAHLEGLTEPAGRR